MKQVALVLTALLFLAPGARGEDALPTPKERIHILLPGWSLDVKDEPAGEGKANKAWSLTVKCDKPEHTWAIDLKWLADRIDAKTIAAGTHVEKMNEYLGKLKSADPQPPRMLAELVALEEGGPLVIAALVAAHPDQMYRLASERGSNILGLSAEQVKALGSVEAYWKELEKLSDAGWKALEERKAKSEHPDHPKKEEHPDKGENPDHPKK